MIFLYSNVYYLEIAMTRAEQLLQKVGEGLESAMVGYSLPSIHKSPAPVKSSWFDKRRGQFIEIYGTKVSEETSDVEVYLHTMDTLIGTLYKYSDTVSLDQLKKMIDSAHFNGLESLSFPRRWTIIKP